jgi:hypothetical protein
MPFRIPLIRQPYLELGPPCRCRLYGGGQAVFDGLVPVHRLILKGDIGMCIPNRLLDRKTRRLMALANISLVIGLLLWQFVHPYGQIERNWLDAACGFLLGLSIAINLIGLIFGKRCRASASGEL